MPQLVQENSKREKCSYNIIVRGLPESSTSIPSTGKADDLKALFEIAQLLSLSWLFDSKLFRLSGKGTNNRSLKVIFPSKELAIRFLSDFNTSKRNASGITIFIFVARGRTLLER